MAGKNKNTPKRQVAQKIATDGEKKIVAQNRKARHNYFIGEVMEAGIILTGTEVKSLRAGLASIGESYAGEVDGELHLLNAHIDEYNKAHAKLQHSPRRGRKLLLHKNQAAKLLGAVQRKGVTIVPLELYFNRRGIAKVLLGIAEGKKQHDKRESIKDRDWQRDKARLMKSKGQD